MHKLSVRGFALKLAELLGGEQLTASSHLEADEVNFRMTLYNSVEILLSKSFHGKEPQNVIDPTENTRPPWEVLKNTMSARFASSSGSPEAFENCVKTSSGTRMNF